MSRTGYSKAQQRRQAEETPRPHHAQETPDLPERKRATAWRTAPKFVEDAAVHDIPLGEGSLSEQQVGR